MVRMNQISDGRNLIFRPMNANTPIPLHLGHIYGHQYNQSQMDGPNAVREVKLPFFADLIPFGRFPLNSIFLVLLKSF
jgi:hypothetical protein